MLATAPMLYNDTHLSTSAVHMQAVERAIQGMHRHFHEALSLEDLAAMAYLSPYHFNRIFRRLIGIPPGEYLSGLRLQEARRMLLTTSASVTDICFDVGYTSTSTFTTRFTQLVGLSPRLLRQQAHRFEPPLPIDGMKPLTTRVQRLWRNVLCGRVIAPEHFQGVIYLGLFPRPIPQGMPVRCTRLHTPGSYILSDIPDGVYYLLTAAFPLTGNSQAYFLPGERHLLLGRGSTPLVVRAGHISGDTNIVLRPPLFTDPPLVMGLPFL